jgi:hypothetical protein
MKTNLTVPYEFLIFFLYSFSPSPPPPFPVSMVLSDTCVNDPNERVIAIAKYYLGDGLAADYIMDFVEHWLSRKW